MQGVLVWAVMKRATWWGALLCVVRVFVRKVSGMQAAPSQHSASQVMVRVYARVARADAYAQARGCAVMVCVVQV